MALSNTQYDMIMASYADLRRAAARTQADRYAEVVLRVPGYRELDERIASLSEEAASKAVALGQSFVSSAEYGKLKEELERIRGEKKALLAKGGFPEDHLELPFTCPDCGDTGYIGNKRCRCFEQKTRDILYRQSNLEELIKTNNFSLLREDFYSGEDLRRFRAAVRICRDFEKNFDKAGGNGSILFYGRVGSGKSFLSICTAAKLLEKGVSVLYFSAGELFERLADATFRGGDRDALANLHDDLYTCDVLLIDDLGAELTNAFVSSALFTIINERQLGRLSTIISTNLEPPEIRERYSDRVFSRLMTWYTVCELNARDVRLMQKA